MTPKEKAIELFENFHYQICSDNGIGENDSTLFCAKQCALIAVEEIMKNFEGLRKPEECAFDAIGERKFTFEGEYDNLMTGYDMVSYYEEVKTEIINL